MEGNKRKLTALWVLCAALCVLCLALLWLHFLAPSLDKTPAPQAAEDAGTAAYTYTEYPLERGGIALHLDCVTAPGAAGGKNWWCVVWPPLCLAASEEEEEEALDVFSPGERKLLTSSGICFRFRLLDLLRRIFGSGR